jgi:hypothetical protein
LQAVLADLQVNNTAQACSDLTSFINHVTAQSGKHLTVSQANQLLAAARQIQVRYIRSYGSALQTDDCADGGGG